MNSELFFEYFSQTDCMMQFFDYFHGNYFVSLNFKVLFKDCLNLHSWNHCLKYSCLFWWLCHFDTCRRMCHWKWSYCWTFWGIVFKNKCCLIFFIFIFSLTIDIVELNRWNFNNCEWMMFWKENEVDLFAEKRTYFLISLIYMSYVLFLYKI